MAAMDQRGTLQDVLARSWKSLRDTVFSPQAIATPDEKVAALASKAAPVIWLIGKVQSGKTSIVRALTEATAAEVGQGYKPCTRTAALFDFPPDAPVIRFLDTRGLGEKGYDPAEDIGIHESPGASHARGHEGAGPAAGSRCPDRQGGQEEASRVAAHRGPDNAA